MVRGLSCSAACGIFPDQGLNLYPLNWQADSYPHSRAREAQIPRPSAATTEAWTPRAHALQQEKPPHGEAYAPDGLPWWLRWSGIHLQCRRPGFDQCRGSWVRKIPWRREWQPTSEFLPGEFHGQRSLAGYRPWDQKESDITEWLTLSFTATKSNHPSQWLEKPCMQQQRPSATKNKIVLKSKVSIIAQRTGEYQVEFNFY